MSQLLTDSEVEEVVSSPRPKPQVVRRPVPVRAKNSGTLGQASAKAVGNGVDIFEYGNSDDEEEDDDDFFRIGRPAAVAEHENKSSYSLAESDASDYNNTSKLLSRTEAAEDMETSGSDYADDSDSDGHKDSSVRAKRKHRDSDEPSPARRTRSRSVSLTPPPPGPHEYAGTAGSSGEDNHAKPPAADDNIYVLDSDGEPSAKATYSIYGQNGDMANLDPSLQEVFETGESTDHASSRGIDPAYMDVNSQNVDHGRSQQQVLSSETETQSRNSSMLEKVQIEFQFVYDEDFLNYELASFWDKARWKRVKITNRDKVVKKLNENIAVIAFTSSSMENALRAYADSFVVNVLATDPVLMYRTMRVFPTSTLASLGNRLAYYIKAYPRSVYNRVREKEAFEQAQLAIEREQTQRELEMVRDLQRNASVDEGQEEDNIHSEGDVGDADSGVQDGSAAGIRIKLRDKTGKDTLLLVTATTSVQAIIENYRRLAGMSQDVVVRLEFDDETLDPGDTIGDTDIENDDMLTVFSS
ncbi:hypothetical protein COEREDRAFT_89831 [Coemansia reversa NRRL 1564]|uniref:Rad60/SUMO-like domain-containing protein n=1 Tax=Coemansia reversa (strain ATCC 12441 / NRRL 1564) TaxID=763665 RepID=A0A2G5B298_COERN|nr:hypothetical protein COEREDRAFT_89831 [Coemansia reversa NRRL 1564]|eukprot:PIA13139.1 hypothetical protein COEREDRAFT_89831 [Coemansia reversa NRRL 1564]